MFFEILVAISCGILAGIFTGLIPGIHVNLVAVFLLALTPKLQNYIAPQSIALIIISCALTHTFLDAIPSIYLGAPDEAHALSALPGHKLLLKGLGHQAILCTVIGSLCSLIISLSLAPFLIPIFNRTYPIIKPYIGYILIIIIAWLILKSKKIMHSASIFFLSGVLGIITLHIPNIENPLLPLLSGLFGISILLLSIQDNTKIPEQKEEKLNIETKIIVKTTFAATIVASIAAFLPGFGSSQAAIIAQQCVGDIKDKGFLILTGGINTVNMAISIITMYTLQKARNGAIVAVEKLIQEITTYQVILFLVAIIFIATIATYLTVQISKKASYYITKVNYKILITVVIVIVIIMIIIFSGIIGIIITIAATALGIVTQKLEIAKNNLLGCLLLPVILYFI